MSGGSSSSGFIPVIFTKPPSGTAPTPYSVSPICFFTMNGGKNRREPLHPHADRLRGDEVAELVQDDQRREAREREEPAQALTASRSTSVPPWPGLRIGLIEVVEAQTGAGSMSRGRPRSRGDVEEAQAASEERVHRHLVCRIQNARRGSAGIAASCASARHAERLGSGGSKLKGPTAPGRVARPARRPVRGSGARRRSAPACPGGPMCASEAPSLRSTIACTIDSAVDDHVDPLVGKPEQVMRLDHLEALVHQRGGVDRDLAAHVPGGMRERLARR